MTTITITLSDDTFAAVAVDALATAGNYTATVTDPVTKTQVPNPTTKPQFAVNRLGSVILQHIVALRNQQNQKELTAQANAAGLAVKIG